MTKRVKFTITIDPAIKKAIYKKAVDVGVKHDSEWGYSNKVVDLIEYIHSVDNKLEKEGEKMASAKT